MPASLTPLAVAAELPGAPKLPEHRASKVHAITTPGAKAARDRVAKGKAENKVQADRARAEARSTWPEARTLTQDISSSRPAGRSIVDVRPARQGKGVPSLHSAAGTATVKVLDQKAAKKAGVTGVLFSVAAQKPGPATVTVDYGSFASAVGGAWSTRLGLARLPSCALTTPEKAECRQATALPSDNNLKTATLTGTVSGLSAASRESAVFAVMATTATSGKGAGDFKATPLTSSSTWEAGGSSGAFTWSYPLPVPPAAAGPAPSLSLSYNSGTIDGRTANTNNQGSLVGEGFDLSSSYIERKYGSCDDDGQTDKLDLCWKYDNASLVLNGKATELVKDDASGEWRLKDDDASQVTRLTGAVNGTAGGEYWKVVTGNGTTYTFGLDKLPGADTQRTNSTWTVPVFGDDNGEPGYDQGATFSARAKVQAWRWNLDLVEDVHGNASTYWYTAESNYYAQNGDKTALKAYVRGGYPTEIRYGQRSEALFTGTASHKVTFSYGERCFASSCASLTETTKQNWPDVPFDSICSETEAECRATGPSFFTRKLLKSVKTYAWSTTLEPDAYAYMDSFDLTQEYLDAGDIGDTTDQTLTLKSLKRTGRYGTDIPLPAVDFTYHMRPNRVDVDGDDVLPLNRPRIDTITSEAGAITTVTYSGQECVRGSAMPVAEDDNNMSCYPVYWPVNGGDPELDWFHKYRVIAVGTADPAGQNELVENAYAYENPGWHYNDDPFTPEDERTWSAWRGYGKVTTYTGAVGTTRSKTVKVFMQGMHGDKRKGTTATRTAVVTGVDLPGVSVPDINDNNQYAGFLRQELTYDGATPISSTVNLIWSKMTASQQKSYADTKAYFLRASKTYKYTYLTASDSWRKVHTETAYDDYGMAYRVTNGGDSAKTGDETCTRTWYARNAAKGLTSLVSRTRTVAESCTDSAGEVITDDQLTLPTSSTSRGDVLSDTATVYDDATVTGWIPNQVPTLGLATWTGRAKAYPAANGTADRDPAETTGWQTLSTTTYDTATVKLGRPLSVTDAAGNVTSTSYTPANTGPLASTVVTAPKLASNGQQHKSYSYVDLRGAVTRSFDANLKETTNTYDSVGRITATWLPNRSVAAGDTANVTYAYSLVRGSQPWSSVSTLKADGTTYRTVYSVFDAALRPLQTQTPSPNGGRILTDTRYDSRGKAYEMYADIWDKDKAPDGVYARAEYGGAPSQTQTVFDGAGRPTTTTFLVFGVQKRSTTTSYTGDSVAATAVQGGTASRVITDALGRTAETRTYSGTTPTDPAFGGTAPGTPFTSVVNTYTRDGKSASITGPDGAKWTYTYDLFGRQVTAVDPDKGTATSTFTALDQLATTKDGRGTTIAYGYDELGRKSGLWKTSKTDANKLAAWTYDTVLKGYPSASTRYEGGVTGKAYTKEVTAYDTLSRATKSRLTIPSDDALVTSGAIAATTEYQTDYRLDGSLSSTVTPAAGGLPSEALTYTYDTHGLAQSLSGTTDYVQDVSYSPLGEVEQLTLARSAAVGVRKTFLGFTREEGTRRLLNSTVSDQTHAGMLQDVTYGYDQVGNVTSIMDAAPLSGISKADFQCFEYDGQRRLTEAWTPKTASCALGGRDASTFDGAAPYWKTYAYSASGQRTKETTHNATSTVERNYCYSGTRPHTLVSTTTAASCTGVADQYVYDAAGNTTKRVQGTTSTTVHDLVWSPEGKLDMLTEGSMSTDYVYDADGELLIRRNPGGETVLYTGGTEVHTEGTKKWATRSYALAGLTVAVRSNESGTSKTSFLASDHHGTSTIAVDSADTQDVSKRYTTPFGASRGTAVGTWPDDKRFLGKPADASTALTHIGAREYDPYIGQFISVDPVLETDKPQTLNGYSYGMQNPLTFSDPTGRELGSPPNSCLYDLANCSPEIQKSVGYDPSTRGTGSGGGGTGGSGGTGGTGGTGRDTSWDQGDVYYPLTMEWKPAFQPVPFAPITESFGIIDEHEERNQWQTSRALFFGWLWGGGYPLGPKQKFRGGDAFTKVLAGDETIGEARAMLLGQALRSGMGAPYAKATYNFGYKDRGPEPGAPWYKMNTARGIYNDFSSVLTNGGLGHSNMADAFLGTYAATARIKSVDRAKGDVRIAFTVRNLSDWNSATHTIPRSWNPYFEKTFGAAVSQNFAWEERLPLNSCGCWVE
ncbi:RHS repeat-associated core domain-containing protein [Streptomyces sp. NPDC101118]|uniref:RHS repeat-associated core domain-containing protein n=1 Tax=Streptomyces sp. NPDC101118 TaxID=3366109 RepID=UPI0038023940